LASFNLGLKIEKGVTNPKIILVASTALVLIGIALSVYQAQLTVENLANQEQKLAIGSQMVVSKDMDPNKDSRGVYSIQVTDFGSDDKVKVSVIDPYGIYVTTKSITKNPFQDFFNVSINGTYKLQIENNGNREIQVLGIIGYYPVGIDTIDMVGFVVLIAGLSGLAIGMMYLIRNRRRNIS
jgi:hypothetical protein